MREKHHLGHLPVDETEGWITKEESAGVKNLFLFVLFWVDGEYNSMEFCCNEVDIGPGAVAGVERAENTNGAVGYFDLHVEEWAGRQFVLWKS